MTQRFGNCEFRFERPNGKPVFAPSELGRKIGRDIKRKIERRFEPDHFYYHLKEGGHVAAIHLHRSKKYFARLDLENFFYSIARNRIARAIQELGLSRGEHYAKWSTVKNPYQLPTYALPYGFVQSPILASLVLSLSPLGNFLREVDGLVIVSVYVDDIAISGNNKRVLERTFRKLKAKVAESGFQINSAKSNPPALAVELFNCRMERMRSVVSDTRQIQFYSVERSEQSAAAFQVYCRAIEKGNQV